MILNLLRSQTHDLHDRMEAYDLSKLMLSPEVTPAGYAAFLASHYRLLAALEPRLDAFFAAQGGEPPYRSAGKHQHIAADLAALGAPLPEPLAADDLPAFETTAQAWGAAYVIEGAAMGGMVLHRALSQRPQLAQLPAFSYLGGGGQPPVVRWQSFCEQIAAHVVDEADQQAALAAARATYEAMGRCLATQPILG